MSDLKCPKCGSNKVSRYSNNGLDCDKCGHMGRSDSFGAKTCQEAAKEIERLRGLIQTLIDNDPEDLVADGGIRVIDVWRKDAERVLNLP